MSKAREEFYNHTMFNEIAYDKSIVDIYIKELEHEHNLFKYIINFLISKYGNLIKEKYYE